MDLDSALAATEGAAQAQAAYSAAITLGLDGTIIYDDIENYNSNYVFPDTGQACNAAVQAYAQAWINEMHTLGGLGSAGIYGGIFDAADFSTSDAAFLPYHDHRATVWHLNHGFHLADNDFNIPALNDSSSSESWTYQDRIHQYVLDNLETWGGVGPFRVDEDIVDARIVPSSQSKPYNLGTFSLASYNETYDFNFLLANSNGTNTSGYTPGEAVGVFGYPYIFGEPQVRSEDGYIWSSAGTASLLEIGPVTTPSGSEAEGVNNLGQVVGYYFGSDGIGHGYMYSPASGTYSTFDQGSFATQIFSINDAGWMLGAYQTDSSGDTECVLYKPTGPTSYTVSTFFSPIASGQCNLSAVNGIGQFGGSYQGSNYLYEAYVEDAENNVPGSSSNILTPLGDSYYSYLSAINNNGMVAIEGGVYSTSGSLIYLDGSGMTSVYGINDEGDTSGDYYDPVTYSDFGFLQQVQH